MIKSIPGNLFFQNFLFHFLKFCFYKNYNKICDRLFRECIPFKWLLPFEKKEVQLAEIKNNFSEINMFYKYLTQKHKTLVNKGEILMKLQNLRNK